jgi:hypothetical protein
MTAADITIRRELLYAGLGFGRLLRHAPAMRTVRIALLDGLADTSVLSGLPGAAMAGSAMVRSGIDGGTLDGAAAASEHATAMASLLAIPGASDGYALLCWPTLAAPEACAAHLAQACAAAPDFILLGFEFLGGPRAFQASVHSALDGALAAGIPVLVPAGNHGAAVAQPLYAHPALVPVTAAGRAWGPVVAARGLAAPGDDIPVVLAGARHRNASGTSFAAALAAAALAALAARTRLPARQLCAALRAGATGGSRTQPPALDVWRAYRHLSLS